MTPNEAIAHIRAHRYEYVPLFVSSGTAERLSSPLFEAPPIPQTWVDALIDIATAADELFDGDSTERFMHPLLRLEQALNRLTEVVG